MRSLHFPSEPLAPVRPERGRAERYGGFPAAMVALLRCPYDGGRLDGGAHGMPIVEGALRCASCGARFPVSDGIVRLLDDGALAGESAHERRLRDSRADAEFAFAHAHPRENALEMSATLAALAPRGRRVLELGCGTGRYTAVLAGQAGEVLAMDFSLASLRILAGCLPAGAPVGLVHADIGHFATAPRAFGACLSTLVSNLPDAAAREAMFRVAAQGLEPDGRLVFSTHHHTLRDRLRGVPQGGRYTEGGIYRYCFRRREIAAEARRHFADVRVRPIQVRLPFARRLGAAAEPLSRLGERVPLVRGLGDLLLVRAERPLNPGPVGA